MEPLISIIIPVYNVEKLLPRCINSLINQTYNNIEIILIDDGSTDNSLEICEEFSKRDSRIVIVKKQNGGQASARNIGLTYATGDYIAFVDSDDFVSENMYETLYKIIKKHDVDIVSCGHELVTEDTFFITDGNKNEVVILDEKKIFLELAKDKILRTYVWDKLYKREMFNGVFFPEGYVFEDVRAITEVLCKASRVAITEQKLYGYTVRNGSTMTIRNAKRFRDEIIAYRYQLKVLSSRNSECEKYIEPKIAEIIRYYIETLPSIRDEDELISLMKSYYKKHFRQLVIKSRRNLKNKISIVVCMLSPTVYLRFCKVIRK